MRASQTSVLDAHRQCRPVERVEALVADLPVQVRQPLPEPPVPVAAPSTPRQVAPQPLRPPLLTLQPLPGARMRVIPPSEPADGHDCGRCAWPCCSCRCPADGRGGGLQIHWQPAGGQVVNNGHTIQATRRPAARSPWRVGSSRCYGFTSIFPASTWSTGSSFPMEMHFVHQAEEGDLAVIGVLMDFGEARAAIQAVWDAIPGVEESLTPPADFDPTALLPEERGYSRYAGSPTTPPCSEVVSWVVKGESITVSQAQIMLSRPVSDEGTSRPAAPPDRDHRVDSGLSRPQGRSGTWTGGLRSCRLDHHRRCRPCRVGPLPWHQDRNAHRLP